MNETGSVQPQSEVDKQLSFCNSNSDELDKQISVLETKLIPVLRRDLCESGKLEEKDSIEITPLANSIRVIGQRTEVQIERLRSIVEKLAI